MSHNLVRPILLAEDSQDDEILLKLVLQKARVLNPVIVVRNGDEAIAQLQKSQHGDSSQIPRIALLDVRMPGKDGLQVLAWIKQQPHLKDLITVMLSHYGEIGTVKTAYELGAYSFLSKPFLLRDLEHLMKHTKPLWQIAPQPPAPAFELVNQEDLSQSPAKTASSRHNVGPIDC